MKLRIIDKQEGNDYAVIDIQGDTISINTRLTNKDYGRYYDGEELVFEMSDNIVSYINPNYQIYIDF